jgi:uncharacterized protein YndB with AHSA1/START domain
MSTDNLRLTRIPQVKVGMLIRRPPSEVFRAFVDPAVTTTFWFTGSTGKVVADARLTWEWEMYGVSTDVRVRTVEEDRLIVLDWGEEGRYTTVEFRFVPVREHTYVRVTETGLHGDGDELAAYAADSTGGFAKVLCAAKALLEHDVRLTVVADHMPPDLEL